MKLRFLLGVILVSMLYASPAGAVAIKIAPLEYRTELGSGASQRGFVDVSNPSSQKLTVNINVQGFRQIDDQGGLQFFPSDQLSAGIVPELKTVELGPREALRLYFTISGPVLPHGDVFAAILATVPADPTHGIGTSARVATLLSIVNGSPGPRQAKITDLRVPLWQLGDRIVANFRLQNPAPASASGGFYPTITVRAIGYFSETVQGPLVFSGRSRSVSFQKAGSYLGLVKIRVAYKDQATEAYSLVVTGYWRWVIPLVLVGLAVVLWASRRLLTRHRR